MKVGIVTLPLHFNYGGILQAFALQETVKMLGADPFIIIESHNSAKQILKSFLYKRTSTYKFIKTNIACLKLTAPFICRELEKRNIGVLLVGSDQVWRPDMGADRENNIDRYFLRTDKTNIIKKIAYAASFGVDNWLFTDIETTVVKSLTNDFTAISVREISGLKLCSQYLSLENVMQVLDPTMLIDIGKYKKLMLSSPFKTKSSHSFVYLLDYDSAINKKIVEACIPKESELLLARVERNVLKKYLNVDKRVEWWLSAIYNSDIVITDSFHGCVFSILFHKDFYVMSNTAGGNTRIQTLLSLFGLNNRLIKDVDCMSYKKEFIDWETIDLKLHEMKEKSITYLQKALKQ
ncbi:MAG: polysaccharide pyruvyl transferase family protein [Bacteroides clarus]|jgi:hypothetical protein|uniref:polysaccharide pyruvyl transferase family protein n=1 Tax=Bacteroides clarus TaxID=626929 RepID=UPI00241FD24B|nr:polysaccharide pyruvyl transferase family protein [Bacteroides clarus]MBD9144782.1 polysaccharide pyruvyl transferase family protein [Bacteroides clarus]